MDYTGLKIYSVGVDKSMQDDFRSLANSAKQVTTSITPDEAYERIKQNSEVILIETRDPANVPDVDNVAGSIVISMDVLIKQSEESGDLSNLDSRLGNKQVEIITTWKLGNRAAVSAQALENLGYTSVSYMDGGMEAWKDKGLPLSL